MMMTEVQSVSADNGSERNLQSFFLLFLPQMFGRRDLAKACLN